MNSEKTELPIKKSSTEDFLLTSSNEPVWTIKNEFELKGLQKIAKVFGSTLKTVSSRVGSIQPAEEEEVIGLGDGVEEAGLLYAHLTGRKYRFAKNLKELDASKYPSIVITSPHLVDNDLLHILYSSGRNETQAAGIISAGNPHLLRKQVLVRAAAAYLSGKLDSIRIDILPLLAVDYINRGRYEIYGGKTTPAKIKSALKRGTGILTIATHSDGLDTHLGKNLTLCPMGQIKDTSDNAISPVCQVTQFCHRQNMPMKEFLQSNKIVSPDEIAARIFIANNCNGMLLPSGMLSVESSLGQCFLNSDRLGAIITTWELTIINSEQTRKLVQNLLAGITIGQALALYNSSQEAKKYGRHRLCLLGDPRVKIPIEEISKENLSQQSFFRKKDKNIQTLNPLDSNRQSKAEIFEVCFKNLLSSAPNKQQSQEIIRILAEIEAFNTATSDKSKSTDIFNSFGTVMRTSILNYLLDQSKLYSGWLNLGCEFTIRDFNEKCRVCKQVVTITEATIKLSNIHRRRLRVCPNCGMLEDSPVNLKLEFFLKRNTLRLRGKLPPGRCSAGVLIGSAENKTLIWDTNEKEMLIRDFKLPEFTSPSFVRIHVIIVWNNDYVVLTQLSRAFID